MSDSPNSSESGSGNDPLMPHQNIPENWVDAVLGAIMTMLFAAISWIASRIFGRFQDHEGRLVTLERLQTVTDMRHQSNIDRLDRIEERGERIEDKLDRLIEREIAE
jgi:hypothetical protein